MSFHFGARFHRMAWSEWGDPHAPPVVCVHGLTRNGRDFDWLASHLANRFRVVCPDLPGRGRSDWLPQASDYALPCYLTALSHLLAVLAQPTGWVGTSLGGICGMMLAVPAGAPLSRIVLNDIGPLVPAAGLARIGTYLADMPASFPDLPAVEAMLRTAPYGTLDDRQWRHLARHGVRSLPDGRLAMHFDPAIATAFASGPPGDIDMSGAWAGITIPRLVIRGELSDLLTPTTAARMEADGARLHIVPGAGHAPALMDQASIAAIGAFLDD